MTHSSASLEPSRASNSPPSPPAEPPRASLWERTQWLLSLLSVGAVLAYLLWTSESGTAGTSCPPSPDRSQDVRLDDARDVYVRDGSPLSRKLQTVAVAPTKIATPVLTVTGAVVAALRPGNGKGNDYWQFNSPELLTTFTDWQKSTADIAFAETQLSQIRQLAETRTQAQQKLVERMKKLVDAGTDTEKDLAAAQAEWIQTQVQGRKEVHEAETAVRLAQRAEAALTRQLQQAGLEPDLLRSTTSDIDIVMADVPEALVARAKLGQRCEARFFGFPGSVFSGKVRAIAPVLSQERRSLRVLFAIEDPGDQLRPGMFADIGLGADAREALLIPSEGVIHIGRSDYVLVHNGRDGWRVTEVQVGELHEAGMEVVGGLRAGDRIAGRGAILLKPLIIQSLHASKQRASERLPQNADRSKSAPR